MRTLRSLFIWGGIILILQVAFAWLMYQVEYANIISVRKYQLAEDQTHNKTTIALERCMAKAVLNHSDNWDRICKAYGLEEGCGLPKNGYALLNDGLDKDNALCRANHQYIAPTVVGPRAYQDESGNPI